MRIGDLRFALLIAIAAIAATGPAQAQDWPQRPVKVVVPYAPGGSADDIARLVAQHLGAAFSQPFVVESRPGASGAIAAESVARAAPDGYTLFLASLPQFAIMPVTLKTSFDPLRDIVPISAIAASPLVLIVHPSLPVTSVAQFVDYVRAQDGELAYAAVGAGSITHLTMAMFLKRAGIAMTPVMYKGGAPALTDIIAGHVKTQFALISPVVPYAKSGMVRLLAVSGAKRVPQIPDVPTMIESGYPGFRVRDWTGLVAPAGTPKQILDRIAREVSRTMQDPETAAHLAANGVEALGSTPEQFADMIAEDIPLWGEAVKDAGIQAK